MRRFIVVFALLLAAVLLSTPAPAQQTQDIISTAIGGGPNDILALDADINQPLEVAVDCIEPGLRQADGLRGGGGEVSGHAELR